MQCPHCGAEHKEEDGRFCAQCGLSVVRHATPSGEDEVEEEDADEEGRRVPCPTCGTPGSPPLCRQCGSRIPRTGEPEK